MGTYPITRVRSVVGVCGSCRQIKLDAAVIHDRGSDGASADDLFFDAECADSLKEKDDFVQVRRVDPTELGQFINGFRFECQDLGQDVNISGKNIEVFAIGV